MDWWTLEQCSTTKTQLTREGKSELEERRLHNLRLSTSMMKQGMYPVAGTEAGSLQPRFSYRRLTLYNVI